MTQWKSISIIDGVLLASVVTKHVCFFRIIQKTCFAVACPQTFRDLMCLLTVLLLLKSAAARQWRRHRIYTVAHWWRRATSTDVTTHGHDANDRSCQWHVRCKAAAQHEVVTIATSSKHTCSHHLYSVERYCRSLVQWLMTTVVSKSGTIAQSSCIMYSYTPTMETAHEHTDRSDIRTKHKHLQVQHAI